jgi:Lrp/AsnC family transcriptional regulator, leucine-responsive regulatory protein
LKIAKYSYKNYIFSIIITFLNKIITIMPNITLDRIDCLLLHYVQSNAKMPNTQLADKLGLSPSPCLRRVKNLEQNGVIKRYVGIIDPVLVGLPISVFVSVRLRHQDRAALEKFESVICKFEEVMECYLMTGTSDYLLRVIVPDMESFEQFLLDKITTIPSIANIESSFSIKQVVYRTDMPIRPNETT